MLHYFYGEDTYAARQAIDTIAQSHQAQVHWLDKNDVQLKPFGEWVDQARGLFGVQVTVLRDVSALPKSLQANVLAVAEHGVAAEVILWDRGLPDRRSVLFKQLKKNSREFSAPLPQTLTTWLQAEAKSRGGNIDAASAQLLITRLGSDRWRLLSELEKLLLATPTITSAEVAAAVPINPEAEIFSTLTLLLQRNKEATLMNIHSLLAAGNSELYLLSMLAWQYRILASVKAGLEAGQSVHEIVRRFNLKLYAVEKSLPFVKNLSSTYALDSLTKILATDFAIKQGKVDARTGLMLLVLGLLER